MHCPPLPYCDQAAGITAYGAPTNEKQMERPPTLRLGLVLRTTYHPLSQLHKSTAYSYVAGLDGPCTARDGWLEVFESGKADGREINLPLLDRKTHSADPSALLPIKAMTPPDKSFSKTLTNTGGFVAIFDFVSCPAIDPFLKLKRPPATSIAPFRSSVGIHNKAQTSKCLIRSATRSC